MLKSSTENDNNKGQIGEQAKLMDEPKSVQEESVFITAGTSGISDSYKSKSDITEESAKLESEINLAKTPGIPERYFIASSTEVYKAKGPLPENLTCDLLPDSSPGRSRNKRTVSDTETNHPIVKRPRRIDSCEGRQCRGLTTEHITCAGTVPAGVPDSTTWTTLKPNTSSATTSQESAPVYYQVPENPAPVSVLPPEFERSPSAAGDRVFTETGKAYGSERVPHQGVNIRGNGAPNAEDRAKVARHQHRVTDQGSSSSHPDRADFVPSPSFSRTGNTTPQSAVDIEKACEKMETLSFNPSCRLKRRFPFGGNN